VTTPGPASAALRAAAKALDALAADPAATRAIDTLAALLAERFAAGHKALICGNGGSACDAMHFAEELTGRFRADRPPLPAIACTDIGHITCTANDYGFEHIYSRWVQGLGRPGDVLIVLSTSGNSPNIARAAAAGREAGLTTVALLGKSGGSLRGRCDHELIVPGETSDRIQELHMLILHTLVEGVEAIMFGHGRPAGSGGVAAARR
jgi:D-sedoheptulose 7-phosphate isomerase